MTNLNKKIVETILLSVTGIGVIGALAAAVLSLFGVIRVTSIETEAMEPTISRNSIAVSYQTPTSEIKAGDIISVRTIDGNNEDTLGRVRTIEATAGNVYSYTLKSDGNPVVDEWIYKTKADSYKLVFSAPFFGAFAQFLKSPAGAAAFMLVIIGFAYFYLRVLHGPENIMVRINRADAKKQQELENNRKFGGVDELSTWFSPKLTRKELRAKRRAERVAKKNNKKALKADGNNE